MSSGNTDNIDLSSFAKSHELLENIVIPENYIEEIRKIQRNVKQAELADLRRQLEDGTHPELVEGIRKIEQEAQQALSIVRASYEMQKEAIERVSEASRFNLKRQHQEEMITLQKQMRNHIVAQIEKKDMFRANYQRTMQLLHQIDNKLESETTSEKNEALTPNGTKKSFFGL